ncbi:MAG: Rieske 2Fe-2S domain-containing protein [Candidatus Binatia bacterium]|nr:Rieske 2Fe-2S domain-containing protein [Candidatus Binatia bacterium]
MVDREATRAAVARIRDREMEGDTPLQALVSQGVTGEPTALRSIERFPYYTSFPFSWYRACPSAQLPVGAVRPVRYLGRDLVVWRGEDGAAHVMDAYCPHLGAHLGYGGRVAGCEIVCPFHWWQFDGDGTNTLIPYLGTRNSAARIPSYPTVDRNGFVFFWYHPLGEAPLWEIPELAEFGDAGWTEYHPALWKVRAPWQELAENGPDFVHLRTVHGAGEVPELESYDCDGFLARMRASVRFVTPRGPQEGRIDTDSWGPGFSIARFSGIQDALFVAVSTPIDFEHTEVSFNYMVKKFGDTPDALEKTQRLAEAMIAELKKQEAEDIVIFDHKIHVPAPKLSAVDAPIVQFRKWAEQFYVDGDSRAANR